MTNEELTSYIKEQTQQGKNKEEIKESLISNGWQIEDVDRAFTSSFSSEKTNALNNAPTGNGSIQPHKESGKVGKIKKLFLFIIIGGLITAALVAVITILVGGFNEIANKALLTLLMVIIHALFALAFMWDDEKHDRFKELTFFLNIVFSLTLLSLFTSIFGIWEIISKEIVLNLYQTYFVIIFATLHTNILFGILKKEKYMDIIVYANYVFIAIVALMLQWVIYVNDAMTTLGDMFFRIIAAAAVIDFTLTILAVIFYKLYIHKYPETNKNINKKTKKSRSIWQKIIIGYLIFQFISILFGILFW